MYVNTSHVNDHAHLHAPYIFVNTCFFAHLPAMLLLFSLLLSLWPISHLVAAQYLVSQWVSALSSRVHCHPLTLAVVGCHHVCLSITLPLALSHSLSSSLALALTHSLVAFVAFAGRLFCQLLL